MNATQYSGGADTHGHAGESSIQKFTQPYFIGESLADDGTLCSTIHKRLYLLPIHLTSDVQHGYVTEELREHLLCELIILVYELLPNLFLDFFLRCLIIRVSIHQSVLLFHLFSLMLHVLFQSFSHYLTYFKVIFSRYGVAQLWILVQNIVQLLGIVKILLLEQVCLSFNLIIHFVVKSLVKEVCPALPFGHCFRYVLLR